MKRNILFLMVAALAVAGCWSKNAPVDAVDNAEYVDCVDCDGAHMVQYSMPNGNDLKLETAHHVIEVQGQPGKKYDYYVWTGKREYSDDPDLIVQDGVAAIRIEE